jgi:hypothetical protein
MRTYAAIFCGEIGDRLCGMSAESWLGCGSCKFAFGVWPIFEYSSARPGRVTSKKFTPRES